MDPNKALDIIRTFVRYRDLIDHNNEQELRDVLDELLDATGGLDEWLSKGGFLPDAWNRD